LVLAACGSSGGGTTIAGLSGNDHGQQDVSGQAGVSLKAASYYFQPSVLNGTPGQAVTLTITNTDSTEHNFTLDAQHINKDINSNANVVVHVTFPANGILSFWCSYHKSSGMVGGLLTSGSVSGAAGTSSSGSSPPSSSGSGGYGGYGGG